MGFGGALRPPSHVSRGWRDGGGVASVMWRRDKAKGGGEKLQGGGMVLAMELRGKRKGNGGEFEFRLIGEEGRWQRN